MIRSPNRQRFRGAGALRGSVRLGCTGTLAFSLVWSPPVAASDSGDAQASTAGSAGDPWWGRDKALHLGLSAGLAAAGYGVSSIWFDPAWQRASAGAAFALTIGAGKELADWAGYGDPSYKDMLYDLAGTSLGVMLAYLVDLAIGAGSEPERAAPQGLEQARPLLAF